MIDFTSPNTVAFLNFIGLGILGVVAAIGQWFGRRKETTPPKDVIVPSLTIADNAAISNMADTLRKANEAARERREHDTEILYTLIAIKDTLGRLETIMGRVLEVMHSPRHRR